MNSLHSVDPNAPVGGLRYRPAILVLAGVFALSAAPLSAADTGKPSATVPGTAAGTNLALSLAEARRLALANNLVLRAEREKLLAAGFLRKAELGAFEPDFVLSSSREQNNRENTIEQTISQGTTLFHEDNRDYGAGIEGLSPIGTKYRLGYTLRDLNNNLRVLSTDPFQRQWQSFFGLTLTQPLLKDMGLSAAMARMRLARGDEALAFQEYRRQMMLVLGAVESSYWDLFVAQERDRLRQASVATAAKLLTENRARVHEGKMAEIELVEAESGVAVRNSRAAEADQRLVEASTKLKTLVAEPVENGEWFVRTADQPAPLSQAPAVEETLSDAFALHPEYLSRKQHVEQEGVRLAYAKNQRWPQIDLKASTGYNGLGDSQSEAYNDVAHQRYKSWSVGVEMRLPVGLGIRAGNELRAAKARQRQALYDLKAAEVEITNNLQGVRQRVESLGVVMSNYEKVAAANQRLLDNEMSRLAEGKSESRRVLEVENNLADAQIALIESRGEYEKARVEFELSAGRLLKVRGVEAEATASLQSSKDRSGGKLGLWGASGTTAHR